MGVKNLWDILESCKKTLPLHHLQNKRLCIDLSCWMVQLQNVNKSHCPLKDKLYLKGLFHRLRALIALNCSLIFVTDGSIPGIKLSTYRRRLKLGSDVNQDELNAHEVQPLRRNMGSEFSCMIKEAKLLGVALGIPCLDGIEEAEAQCALLNSESLCDGCFTSDSDIFLFGARTVYRDICLGEGGYVVCYEMTDIESKLGFGRNSLKEVGKREKRDKRKDHAVLYFIPATRDNNTSFFLTITLAVLLGSDYSQKVYGIGPESACQIVKSIGDTAVLQRIASEGLSFAKKPKNLKQQQNPIRCNYQDNFPNNETGNYGSKQCLKRNSKFMEVINAYLKPKCHLADSDVVRRVLALYPFQRSKLIQICGQYFEWPPEKTDEYILPKVAERELRRFANLHSVLSEFGVPVPLDEMPVECPIHEIIKRRKVQGRDCFEVSWEEMEGIKTSIVPADLVESACPEKIMEFEQRRDPKKKQHNGKRRSKKSDRGPALDAIDQKLQQLMLDIEQESNGAAKASSSDSSAAATLEERSPIIEVDSCDPTVATNAAEREVIDLLSPSPAIHGRTAPKFENGAQCINVIDLCDSETDSSPEHARKARELRLFLSSIKENMS